MKPNDQNRQSVGKFGEELARDFLTRKGYQIIESNFRIRGGELDIIAKLGDTLVFVEVKTRQSIKFGLPEEAITRKKLKDTLHAISVYTTLRRLAYKKQRLDVISILLRDTKEPYITHFQSIT